jgi:hypothetical protein
MLGLAPEAQRISQENPSLQLRPRPYRKAPEETPAQRRSWFRPESLANSPGCQPAAVAPFSIKRIGSQPNPGHTTPLPRQPGPSAGKGTCPGGPLRSDLLKTSHPHGGRRPKQNRDQTHRSQHRTNGIHQRQPAAKPPQKARSPHQGSKYRSTVQPTRCDPFHIHTSKTNTRPCGTTGEPLSLPQSATRPIRGRNRVRGRDTSLCCGRTAPRACGT